MSDYSDRQEARRQRLLRRAEQARQERDRRWNEADRMGQAMNGQPILVGHHSEKRHRRDIERMHTHGSKGLEAHNAAAEYERQAEAVGKGGISADDPEAVVKLRAKLEALQRQRDQAKAINAHWRKRGTMVGFSGLSEERAAHVDAKMKAQQEPGAGWAPDKHKVYPGYFFQNIGANIKRIEKRIKELEHEAERQPAEAIQGDGWTIEEDAADNRLLITFDEKPSREVCALLRRHGFKWSPTRVSWVRQLNESARYAASVVQQTLSETPAS